jgi:hypothetical protein
MAAIGSILNLMLASFVRGGPTLCRAIAARHSGYGMSAVGGGFNRSQGPLAAFVGLASKPPLAAFAHQKNWIEVPSVRLLQFSNLVCGRSEGPQSALHVEMCMVQQSDCSLIHDGHSRPKH